MEKKFLKVRSNGNIAVSISTIVIGCVCSLIPNNSSVNLFGIFAIIAGIILMLVLKSEYIDLDSNKRYKKKIVNFALESKEHLLKNLATPKELNKKRLLNGESLMLVIYHNKENAYMQLYEFIPHQYVACSDVHMHDIASAKMLMEM